MFVSVLNKDKTPIDMCHPAKARKLIKHNKAVVHKKYPFVIRLKEQKEMVQTPDYECKIDPGSKVTGVTITKGDKVVMLAELHHKKGISESLTARHAIRRSRRSRKTRYRRCKFPNKTGQTSSFTSSRPKSWIAPSLQSRVRQTENLLTKLMRYMPISSLSLEHVKFDTQLMKNPEMSGLQYQQGELAGYEIREYLLEKWQRRCAYCLKIDVKLQIEHIHPRSRGGCNNVSNLTIACKTCNAEKDNHTLEEWGKIIEKKKSTRHKTITKEIPKVLKQCTKTMRDASVVNTTRWALYNQLKSYDLPVTVQSGAKTKMQRIQQGLPKEHYYDALCVGKPQKWSFFTDHVIEFHATGRGNRQMARIDKFGFPLRHTDTEKYDSKGKRKGHRERKKMCHGFQTGDIVSASVPAGKKKGNYFGRVAIRHTGSFDIKDHPSSETIQGISWKHCLLVQRNDGWDYKTKDRVVSSHS